MDTEVAWSNFVKSREEDLHQASLSGKLDTISAQLQENNINTKRLVDILPRVLGDEGALDMAAGAPPDVGAMGADPMGADPMAGGEEMPPMDGGSPPMEEPTDGGMDGTMAPQGVDSGPSAPEDLPEEPTADMLGGGDAAPAADMPMPEMGGGYDMDLGPEMGLGEMSYVSEPFASDPYADSDPGLIGSDLIPGTDLGIGPAEDPAIAYGRLADTLKDATRRALGLGDVDLVSQLADSLVVIDQMFKSDVCPALDRIYGTDRFSKSVERPLIKSEDNTMSDNEIVKADDEKKDPEEKSEKDDAPKESKEDTPKESESEGDIPAEDGHEESEPAPGAPPEAPIEGAPAGAPSPEEMIALLAQIPPEILQAALMLAQQGGTPATAPGTSPEASMDSPVPMGESGVPEAQLPPVIPGEDATMKSETIVDCEAVDVPAADDSEGEHGTGGNVAKSEDEMEKGEGGLAGLPAQDETGDGGAAEPLTASESEEPMDAGDAGFTASEETATGLAVCKSGGMFSQMYAAQQEKVAATRRSPGMDTLAKGEGVATFNGESLCKSKDELSGIFQSMTKSSMMDGMQSTCMKPEQAGEPEGSRDSKDIVKTSSMMKAWEDYADLGRAPTEQDGFSKISGAGIRPDLYDAQDGNVYDHLGNNIGHPDRRAAFNGYFDGKGNSMAMLDALVADKASGAVGSDMGLDAYGAAHPDFWQGNGYDEAEYRNAISPEMAKKSYNPQDNLASDIDAAEDMTPTDTREFTGTAEEVAPIQEEPFSKSGGFADMLARRQAQHLTEIGGKVPQAMVKSTPDMSQPVEVYGNGAMVKSGQTRQIQSMMSYTAMRKSYGMDSTSADRAGSGATMSGAFAKGQFEDKVKAQGMSITDLMAQRRSR